MDFATQLRATFPESQETIEELSLVVLREYQRRNGFEEWCAVARWTAALSPKENTADAMHQWHRILALIETLRIGLTGFKRISRWHFIRRARLRRRVSALTLELYRELFALAQRDWQYLAEWNARGPTKPSSQDQSPID